MRAWDFGSGCLTSDPVSGGQCPPGATDPFLTTRGTSQTASASGGQSCRRSLKPSTEHQWDSDLP